MTSTFSINKGIEEPAAGDYVNAWASPVNSNWTAIDVALGGTTSISVTGISAPTTTLTLIQYRPPNIEFTGVLGANLTYQIPAGVGGMWSINNATSGAFSLSFSIAAGNSLTLGGGRTLILSNGTTIALAGLQNVTAIEIGTLLYPVQGFEAGSVIVAIQYAPLDPRRYASIADWSNAYSQVSAYVDTEWPFYRGDHALHPTQTNAIAGYKTFDDSQCIGTVGYRCTVFGARAMQFNGQSISAGGTNTAFGWGVMENCIECSGNTAVGAVALNSITGLSSSHNNAFGYRVLTLLVDGTQNNCFGFQVMNSLITGNNNHCYGENSASSITLGQGNHCYGYQTKFSAVGGSFSHCFGYQSLFAENAANVTAITVATNAVVTINTVSVSNPFTVGSPIGVDGNVGMTQINGLSGVVLAIGGSSGSWTVTTNINSSGFSALTSGGYLYPVGNTAFGYQSGATLVFSGGNTITGWQAGQANPLDINNSLYGFQAGMRLSIGGQYNCAYGFQSLINCVGGVSNCTYGQQSGTNITTGSNNVCIGDNTGRAITVANGNVYVGSTAGVNVSGTDNTGVGFNAGSAAIAQAYIDAHSFGANSQPNGSHQVTLGSSTITLLRCQQTSITALSDERFKKDIEPLELPATFLDEVQVVAFNWIAEDMGHHGRQVGIIAQQLDALQAKYHVEWLGLVDKSNPDRWEATPGKLLFPLIQRVQKQEQRLKRIEEKLGL